MSHRPYPNLQRALHQAGRHRAAHPAHPVVPALAALGASVRDALANAADAVHGFKSLGFNAAQLFAVSTPAGRAALERAIALEDYRLAAGALGIPRRRANEILTAVQGPAAGSTPTVDELSEARRQMTREATGDGFRYSGIADLITGDVAVPLAEVYLCEDAVRYFGPGLDGVEHLLADRHSWSGTATASQHGANLLLHTDSPLTLRLADGREAQARVHSARPDPPNGTFRITLTRIGRPPQHTGTTPQR
ncbi:hypothetical protein [Kitasatospora cineracea]|uniref:Uncharacterized protein n=1 Tax=Kitasatospora cineracea TaxID=88074 RepID=A0A3N4RG07_9ACTN|nr:hypothetical protein [Kitasatospora cineracea]RPE27327.1 hypothetical protein EDD38_7472 [Kitasatospora cineracea]